MEYGSGMNSYDVFVYFQGTEMWLVFLWKRE